MARFLAFCAKAGFEPEPYQRRIAAPILAGGADEVLVSTPRGQGKTTLLAAIAVNHMLEQPDAQIYCAAASRRQASILYEAAVRFARSLDDPNVVVRHLELRWCPDPDEPRVFTRFLRVLAADAPKLHGLTYSLALVDELHAHPDDEVYLALQSALHKRPGARLATISTAGYSPDTPLGRLRARALAQPDVKVRGVVTDARGPHLRMLEWSVPDDADVDDVEVVKQANPASWITRAKLRQQRDALPEVAFRRYVCNQWTSPEGAWLPPGAWQEIEGEPEFEPGERIWVGVDVGGERSNSAVVWVNERFQVGCAIFRGDAAVFDVIDKVRELADEYTVVEVAYDPWRFMQAAQELERERIPTIAFPQTDQRMCPASDRLLAAVTEKRLVVPADPELRRHAGNAIARHSRRGWRIDKANRSDNVDALVALAMAVDRLEQRPAPTRLLGWI